MKVNCKKMFCFFLVCFLMVSSVPTAGNRVWAQEEVTDVNYEIYPVPRNLVYQEDNETMELQDAPNLVLENGIDEATKNRLHEILALKGITGSASDALVSGKTNILVGVKDSGGAADSWFDENVTYEAGHFDRVDAYVLAIQDDVIAVLGKDTDAAFYGLSTLKLIVEQTKDRSIRKLQVDDYASGQYRGFIEEYYGIPWSVEDRISLMKFGGDFKMNIYIFAPKDDPYHNSRWREEYPEEQLNDIKRMVDAGAAAKCRFAWAIHPFMNDPITLEDYEEGLEAIQNKFESLYEAGVRQFVISADDAGSNAQLQANLCRDMSRWVKEHEGCYNLCFVPMMYCTGTQNWGYGISLSNYYNYFKGEDFNDVEIMWTGESVCSQANQTTCNNFRNLSSKDPFLWMNWPVNDVNHSRLVMGPAENGIYQQNLTGFKGLVTNPLEQAEASKTSLFATADFAWNTTDFSCFTSWEHGFQYIEPQAMHELCKHLTNPSPGGITSMGESTELEPFITAFTTAYDNGNGTDYAEEAAALIAELQKIVKAADEFQEKGTNANLQDEMKPWVDSLRYLSKACIGFIQTAQALTAQDPEAVAAHYLSAVNHYKASQRCEAPQLNGSIMVEAGAMKIMPFAERMSNAVKEGALEIFNTEFGGGDEVTAQQTLIYSGLGAVSQGKLENATDGEDGTFVWFNTNVSAGAYIGLDLGDTYKLDRIRILQGKEPTHGDIFSNGILEYSVDNENWEQIGTYTTNDIEENVLDRSLTARYIRLRTPVATNKWYAIREFSVTVRPVDAFVYTNAEACREYRAVIDKTEASIEEIAEEITLGKGEYIGLEFPAVREVTSLTAEYTKKDRLVLESSYNGFDWVSAGSGDARYIRIVNKNSEPVTFRMTEFSVRYREGSKTIFSDPAGTPGHEALKAKDQSILTAFTAAAGNGSLTWRMPAEAADELYILQDAGQISNAKVQIRTNTKAWVDIGTLNKSRNVFEIYPYGFVNEVRITWEDHGPTIYEIYTKAGEHTNVETLTAVLEFAKTQKNDGFTEESFAAFQKALAAAEEELQKPDLTEEEAAEVLEAFYEAAANLKPKKQEEGPGENPGQNPDPAPPTVPELKIGDAAVQKNLKYRVTDPVKKEAAVCGVDSKKKKNTLTTVKILSTVTVKGIQCKVTSIDGKAFSDMKKLKKVTIGGNVRTIGAKAFFKDKNLKKIVVKSNCLEKVAKNAFKKASTKGTIKVPKKKKKNYVKLFKKCTKMKVK